MELRRPISPVAWMLLAIVLLGFTSLGSILFDRDAWQHPWLDQLRLAIVAVCEEVEYFRWKK